jgi:hypothetical protein
MLLEVLGKTLWIRHFSQLRVGGAWREATRQQRGFRQLFEAGGNIDPLAVTVVTVNYHLAKIYPDPDQNLLVRGKRGIALD